MHLSKGLTEQEQEHFDRCSEYARRVMAIYEPFFMYHLYKLKITAVKSTSHGGSRAVTDGRVIEFQYPAALSLDDSKFAGLTHHELQHVTNLHIPRSAGKNHFIWNVACDISVNEVVAALEERTKNRIMWAVGGIRVPTLARLSVDEIYKKLMQEQSDDYKTELGGKVPTFKYKDNHGKWQQVSDSDMDFQFGGDLETLGEDQLNMLRGARTAYGSLGSGIDRFVTDLLDRVKVDWKVELRKYITRHENDFSFQHRDRRFQNFEFFIPDIAPIVKGSLQVRVGIDLSGSISRADISKMITECIGIQKIYRSTEFTFIPFDVQTYGEFKATNANEIIEAFGQFQGGGGTSFVSVLKALDTKKANLILMFTDLAGKFPEVKPKADVIWVNIDGISKRTAPFGRIVDYV